MNRFQEQISSKRLQASIVNLRRWCAAAPFEDEERNRVSKVFNRILMASMVSALLTIFLVIPFSTTTPGEEIAISTFAVFILALAKSVVHRGHLERAITLFLVVTWLLLAFSVYEFEGGLRGAVISWFSVHVLASGLLFGSRAGIVSAGFSAVATTVLWQAEEQGMYVAILDDLGAMWSANIVIFVMIAILLHLAVSSIQSALSLARENARHLEAERAKLAATNAELEAFLFAIGHDLQEPLRSVRNFGDLLQKRHQPHLDTSGQDYVKRMVAGAERMQELLHDCVLLSQVRHMKGREWVSAEMVVKKALEQIQPQCGGIVIGQNLPNLFVNQKWAVEAVSQLLDNAIKFSFASHCEGITIDGYAENDVAGLIIRDRGMGLNPDHASRVFRLFKRGVGREVKGTGAGLTLVRQIAEHHGGSAWAEPRKGGGSNFYITFSHQETQLV